MLPPDAPRPRAPSRPGRWRWLLAGGGLALLVALLAGCSTLGYVRQAAVGQVRILHLKRPIADWLADPSTAAELRERLELAREIRRFAVRELALPDEGYRTYAELPRLADGSRPRSVVWNVFAAPELSLEPRTWCFPVAGCVVYRGYFSRERALRFARGLAADGDDVSVRGAAAYSTLGWFSDPLLSTVIEDPPLDLAALIFHELAHQEVWIPGRTEFNEAFATVVEQEGVRRWIEARSLPTQETARFRRRRQLVAEHEASLIAARQRLAELYTGPRTTESKLVEKDEILGDLSEECRQRFGLSESDPRCRLNNADLAAVATYRLLVPELLALLREVDFDLGRFYSRCRALAESHRSPGTEDLPAS